ncbi:flavin-containing monooxygenase FMO GS-OX-like 8 [Aspergillus udagawae]|uniref:Flavin-containing monooxygenase FMO GS-OX-like 8 n=1 Tax=Aspergillus udagawae TaxID=91492 RepID=A0ABQ1AQD2_9EURO|nr:flavin-containing monooxygenase FMO GS-OX-like 8 [Aspergillus udagawae]GFF86157.1 flavin-containing monooxygenase FMO GS-OX-like 8 [Aspergillus udagawae]GFG27577.1 flavin-containing monooxygenase FMO GS-OX-like 8 [Aspergillus udagawae]
MLRPKKVAIIGAGPSGLVTAKTLLHHSPQGTFTPSIFEKSHEIGGLWPIHPNRRGSNSGLARASKNHGAAGPVNPSMRTNLSRFTVSFSDLAWESVLGTADVPMFPQAWQVGRYLETYAERYLPDEVVRLGCEVVHAVREVVGGRPRWTVQWVQRSGKEEQGDDTEQRAVETEYFDFLVVASGYFSRPYTPDIPGLAAFADSTVHSSALRSLEDLNAIVEKGSDGGRLVVVGGSMSGVEAASSLALHVSSLRSSPEPSMRTSSFPEIYHISSRPFWTVPTYIPHTQRDNATGTETVSLLPLDLAMYDLARRPPGPVEYAFGPVSAAQVAKVNDYFRSVLGEDYTSIGPGDIDLGSGEEEALQPPWVAIGNDYAEFVRSKVIRTAIGRVSTVHASSPGRAKVDIELPGKESMLLDDVAGIVLATGFTPFPSLAFLPEDVLSALEYSPEDSFFPLILDGKGTTNANIPDLGFVGFYRGPYWGVMEMQARSLAHTWARADTEHGIQFSAQELESKARERQSVRAYRNADPDLHRGQFPMGDYTGLMESFARDLGICRAPLLELNERPGPVVPARYATSGLGAADIQTSLQALQETLQPTRGGATPAVAMAIFRALHGSWDFTRSGQDGVSSGISTFSPRYPSSPAYEKEYLYEESGHKPASFVYRLTDSPQDAEITVWSADSQDKTAVALSYGLRTLNQEGSRTLRLGEYTIHAAGTDWNSNCTYEYVFRFNGAAISSWEYTVRRPPDRSVVLSTTLYRRVQNT